MTVLCRVLRHFRAAIPAATPYRTANLPVSNPKCEHLQRSARCSTALWHMPESLLVQAQGNGSVKPGDALWLLPYPALHHARPAILPSHRVHDDSKAKGVVSLGARAVLSLTHVYAFVRAKTCKLRPNPDHLGVFSERMSESKSGGARSGHCWPAMPSPLGTPVAPVVVN